MTLYWPPEKTFQYKFKDNKELVLTIPMEDNKKKENKGMEKQV